jgi:hypothetical protein
MPCAGRGEFRQVLLWPARSGRLRRQIAGKNARPVHQPQQKRAPILREEKAEEDGRGRRERREQQIQKNIGAQEASRNQGGDQERGRGQQRKKVPPSHSRGPEDRQSVRRAPEAPSGSRATNPESRG